MKGNFDVLSLSSQADLTFPTLLLGFNTKTTLSLCEGRNSFCQEILYATSPIFILNSVFLKSFEFQNFLNLFHITKKRLNFPITFSVVPERLEDTGVNLLKCYKSVVKTDFKSAFAFYYINVDASLSLDFKKIINFKALNLMKISRSINKIVKIVNSAENSKSSWYISRSFYSLLSSLNFASHKKDGVILSTKFNIELKKNNLWLRLKLILSPIRVVGDRSS